MSDPGSHKQHFARPTAAPCLEALARLLARQAAAEAWRRTGCVDEQNAGPEVPVGDHHEQGRRPDRDERITT